MICTEFKIAKATASEWRHRYLAARGSEGEPQELGGEPQELGGEPQELGGEPQILEGKR